ncbi:hypothetical protein [Tellurirhabdus bombi]|uniref:hypothetical protein n=1 Tax=Tellurirhabdus bombi TaxID=2907205 RepID=UPI001F1FEB8B|nr:hypothetical protein [Tellurirhabdus bombi]
MKNPSKITRSGASQASSLEQATQQENNSGRLRSTGTSMGDTNSEDTAGQPHTAGGTTSPQPRQIDRQ